MDIMPILRENKFLLISVNNISNLNNLNMKIYFIKHLSCQDNGKKTNCITVKKEIRDAEKMTFEIKN